VRAGGFYLPSWAEGAKKIEEALFERAGIKLASKVPGEYLALPPLYPFCLPTGQK
jgi:hypothetical protein